MGVSTKAAIQTLINQITDGGGNTAQEVRTLLTDMLDTLDAKASAEGFESISRNIAGYPATLAYNGSNDLVTQTFTTPTGTIVKTFAYLANGDLDTITLSGDLPAGINTVKTFSYDGSNNQTGFTYS